MTLEIRGEQLDQLELHRREGLVKLQFQLEGVPYEPLWPTLEALITLARRGLASQWQPIETAPKDGTRILVYRKGAKRYPLVSVDSFESVKWPWPPCWYHSPSDEQPTHWMPLPEPPKS